jgi:branched-chain amino acid transport system permease protein
MHVDIGGVPLLTVMTQGLARAAIFGLMGLGIALVYKTARVVNFAQGEIGTVAAFAAWWLITQHGQPWIVGALGAVVVAGAIGYLMHRLIAMPMRDAPRPSLMIATLGVAFLLYAVELSFLFHSSPRNLPAPITEVKGGFPLLGNIDFTGVFAGPFILTPVYVVALAVVVLAAALLALLLTRTRFGLGVLATAEDAVSARLLGIPSTRVSAFTWMIAAVLSAIAALLIIPADHGGSFSPFELSGFVFFRGLVAALIGGMDSLSGALIGAVVVGEIDSFSAFAYSNVPGLSEIVLLAVVLVVILLRPRGFLGSAVTA